MKIRMGFVSNSSSSSFLVISPNSEKIKVIAIDDPLIIPDSFSGTLEFGRECEDYYELGSKINWALCFAGYWDWICQTDGIPSKEQLGYKSKYWENRSPSQFMNLVPFVKKVIAKNIGSLGIDPEKIKIHLQIGLDDDQGPKDVWRNGYDMPKIVYYSEDEDFNKDDKGRTWSEVHIDHGSMFWEAPENLEIFFSEENLENFLFRRESYIANRGDEYDCDDMAPKLKDGDWETCSLGGYEDDEDE